MSIWYRQADRRFPFLHVAPDQPSGRWHGDGEGPVQYLADTPDGAWAELLRHWNIRLAEDIPADAEEGRALRFTAVDDLLMNGTVVVPRGASVTGEISETAGKKKFLGIAGGSKLSFKLTQSDTAGGQKMSVRATPQPRRGDAPAQRPVETAGPKPKAKEIAALAGTEYVAYVDGDQSVSIRK